MQKESKLYLGDCLEIMPQFETDSIDAIVTDPPYGLKFMNKKWDASVPSIDIWQECLRVLKPGAFAFVMSSPRQDVLSRMICRLEDAGFNIGFSSIYWTYATGFPKAQNIQKTLLNRLEIQLKDKYKIDKIEWEE
jgi:site-specific DNA-methyltransferase (adenine-specific)